MAAGTGRVFISYRRQETAWPARQLYELLAGRFGAEKIFKDVDNIAPGEDFVEKLTSAVSNCQVLLALIGPQWLDLRDAEGNRRLDDPNDFVRLELSAALQRGVLVVPILVDGARMPAPAALPPELGPLTRRQAVEINPVGFNTDRLMATLTEVLDPPDTSPVPGPTRRPTEPVPVVPITRPPPAWSGSSGPAAPAVGAPAVSSTASFPSTGPAGPVVGAPDVSSTAAAAAPPPEPRRRSRLVVPGVVGVGVLVVAAGVWLLPGALRPAATPAAHVTVSSSPGATSAPTEGGSPAATFPTIVAHRGGLEAHQFETQQAMEASALAGYAVETDVRYTRDGVAVLVHDDHATKGLDCGGADLRVSRVTWATLRRTCHSKPTSVDPASYDVPTLDATVEAIAAASPDAWILAELKTDQTAAQRKAYLATFAKYGMTDRLVATSFDRSRLAAIGAIDPGTRRMLFVQDKRVAASTLASDGLWGVAVEQGIATASYTSELQRAGLKVMIWVPDDEAHWTAAVALKPDIVMTDYPARYQKWLAAR
ncbi:glycerophosphodiester phosphodiesterase family protein [Propionicimonas sp.]|uniref:glycerophosphodiester phosphodiesterase family protein n=1 Tax=Propionicimonas sp. TaxID=1955623 RepID=UPI0039E63B83